LNIAPEAAIIPTDIRDIFKLDPELQLSVVQHDVPAPFVLSPVDAATQEELHPLFMTHTPKETAYVDYLFENLIL